jgi:hypothetical protein
MIYAQDALRPRGLFRHGPISPRVSMPISLSVPQNYFASKSNATE